jgi:hypothetical protein
MLVNETLGCTLLLWSSLFDEADAPVMVDLRWNLRLRSL